MLALSPQAGQQDVGLFAHLQHGDNNKTGLEAPGGIVNNWSSLGIVPAHNRCLLSVT